MFRVDECWRRRSAKCVRRPPEEGAAAGLDMTDSNLLPAGVEAAWGLQVLIRDAAGFRHILPSAL